jgi:hypothetical protein
MAVMPIWVVNPSKREVAEAPWAARCGVLSRVLASHHSGHLDDGRSAS